ncbi:hypothetical protein BDF14DRAFT_1768245 [Spinellus fusiger]|nr:hypothetical protein BDF14DRAFT_1768245 [Spinellus fusiger]
MSASYSYSQLNWSHTKALVVSSFLGFFLFVVTQAMPVFDADLAANPFIHDTRIGYRIEQTTQQSLRSTFL